MGSKEKSYQNPNPKPGEKMSGHNSAINIKSYLILVTILLLSLPRNHCRLRAGFTSKNEMGKVNEFEELWQIMGGTFSTTDIQVGLSVSWVIM